METYQASRQATKLFDSVVILLVEFQLHPCHIPSRNPWKIPNQEAFLSYEWDRMADLIPMQQLDQTENLNLKKRIFRKHGCLITFRSVARGSGGGVQEKKNEKGPFFEKFENAKISLNLQFSTKKFSQNCPSLTENII